MGPVKQDSSMPPKMTTLPAASLDDAGKKNEGRFCRVVQCRAVRPQEWDADCVTALPSSALTPWHSSTAREREPRWNHVPGNSFPASHKPSGEAGGPQPSHTVTQTRHLMAAVTRDEPEPPANDVHEVAPPSPAPQAPKAHQDR